MFSNISSALITASRHLGWISLAFGGALLCSWIVQGRWSYMLIGYGVCFFLVSWLRTRRMENHRDVIVYLILATLIPVGIIIGGAIWSSGSVPVISAPFWLTIPVSHMFCYMMIRTSKLNQKYWAAGYVSFLLLAGVVGFPIWSSYYATNIWHSPHSPLLNKSIPDEVVFEDENGNPFNMNDLKGKIVVMNFWSTSCGLCFKGFPSLETFYNEMKHDPDLLVMAVNLPLEGENRSQLQHTNGFDQYRFPKLYARYPEAWNQLGIRAVPLTIILDKEGKIRHVGGLNILWHNFFNNNYTLIKQLKQEPYQYNKPPGS